MSYTINAINGTTVSVTFSYDNVEQVIDGLDLSSADALTAALAAYEAAYVAGKTQEQVQPSADVTALVGEVQGA